MILMSVGDHKPFHFLSVILQVSHIRYHQIDSQHIILWKSKPAVHHNNTVIRLKCGYIHTNLF